MKNTIEAAKNGQWFSALISGTPVIGKVIKENADAFLLQNFIQGASSKNKMGFNKSWCVGRTHGDPNGLYRNNVTEFKLHNKKPKLPKVPKQPKEPKTIPLNESYVAKIFKGYITVGCQRINNKEVMNLFKNLKK